MEGAAALQRPSAAAAVLLPLETKKEGGGRWRVGKGKLENGMGKMGGGNMEKCLGPGLRHFDHSIVKINGQNVLLAGPGPWSFDHDKLGGCPNRFSVWHFRKHLGSI